MTVVADAVVWLRCTANDGAVAPGRGGHRSPGRRRPCASRRSDRSRAGRRRSLEREPTTETRRWSVRLEQRHATGRGGTPHDADRRLPPSAPRPTPPAAPSAGRRARPCRPARPTHRRVAARPRERAGARTGRIGARAAGDDGGGGAVPWSHRPEVGSRSAAASRCDIMMPPARSRCPRPRAVPMRDRVGRCGQRPRREPPPPHADLTPRSLACPYGAGDGAGERKGADMRRLASTPVLAAAVGARPVGQPGILP